jgi:hypothetical protein
MDVDRERFIAHLRALGFTEEEGSEAGAALTTAQQDVAALVQTVGGALRRCRSCGCTDSEGCPPDPEGRSCWWVQWDLCSRCAALKTVCLCGSSRFSAAYQQANLRETLAGRIVLTIGCDMRSDADLFVALSEQARADLKARLDWLHLRKIDAADEILVLNVDGYIGDSTRREIAYAVTHGKGVRWWEPDSAPPLLCPRCGACAWTESAAAQGWRWTGQQWEHARCEAPPDA